MAEVLQITFQVLVIEMFHIEFLCSEALNLLFGVRMG